MLNVFIHKEFTRTMYLLNSSYFIDFIFKERKSSNGSLTIIDQKPTIKQSQTSKPLKLFHLS